MTPAMRRIEAEDPDRRLAGLENRLKGRERLTEKVLKAVSERGHSVDEAFGLVKDVIRYTFCYPHDRYTSGVHADCDRLRHAGFGWIDRENSWTKEQYRGINSRWRVPGGGQVFEVQFHTETYTAFAFHKKDKGGQNLTITRYKLPEARGDERELGGKRTDRSRRGHGNMAFDGPAKPPGDMPAPNA